MAILRALVWLPDTGGICLKYPSKWLITKDIEILFVSSQA